MITLIDKIHIIKLIEGGMPYRAVSRKTGVDRKTITRYYKEHHSTVELLSNATNDDEIRTLQNRIIQKPEYSEREPINRKWTKEMSALVDLHLDREQDRNVKFGPNHKQHIAIVMMHELLLQAGHDIGLTTVRNHMFKKKEKIKEVYVRQVYEPGQRFEFDFGEVYLYINDTKQKYYLAVMSSPYSNYRTAYLYNNQGQKVFLDAHNRLFKEIVLKNYVGDIEVFYNHKLACRHEKKDGNLEYVIDITHFLQTFKRKPGALKNSEALQNNPKLKSIFENIIPHKENILSS